MSKDEFNRYIAPVVMIATIILFFGFIIYILINPQYPENYDKFCLEQNLSEVTDYKYNSWTNNTFIECDDNEIFQVTRIKICERNNKWGECTHHSLEFELNDASTRNKNE